jgi:hypothetical protein
MLRHGRSGLCSVRIVLWLPVIFWFPVRRVRLVRHAVVWNALLRHALVWNADGVRLRTAVWLSSVRLLLGGLRMRFPAIFALPRQ